MTKKAKDQLKIIEKPQILTLNLTEKSNASLKDEGYNIYEGSLGKLVDTKNNQYESKYLLLNHDFPANSHEFDIVIVDFSNEEVIDYVQSEHIRHKNRTENNSYLLCKYPQVLFDPRGLSSKSFLGNIKEILKKDCLIIVFQNKSVDLDYKIVERTGDRASVVGTEDANIYELVPKLYFEQNKYGKETKVIPILGEFTTFLNRFNDHFTYENIFFHPRIRDNNRQIPDPNFYPLVLNLNDEIVSYLYYTDNLGVFITPVLEDNSTFLTGFLESIAPSLLPVLFPNSTKNKWTQSDDYFLPNQKRLIEERDKIEAKFKKALDKKDEEIRLNNEKYLFLHQILTETGDELVTAVIQFLEWLGFESIIDVDNRGNGLKEEDIRIETDKGLLVIEVKGIGGTSKDSDCSQISKVKYRRAKERGEFDVFGLYIVNHQRHLPARNREHPPFSKEQIDDAKNEERGILTTWALFNLYFDIQNEILTKNEAREILFSYGLISFKPQNIMLVDTINETFQKGEIFILKLDKTRLCVGDILFIQKNHKFKKLKVLEIKLDDKKVKEISEGEIGVKGSLKVSRNSKVWIKDSV